MSPPDDRPLRATDGPRGRSRGFPVRRMRGGEPELPRAPSQPRAAPAAAEAPATMFNQQQQLQQLQQQQLQQQQLLQLQQLLQQSPPQPPLPMAVSRGLPQQQPQQQLLNLQGASPASLLNGSVLQRALLLQQLQGLDQFAMPPATSDSVGLTMPTATLGNLRGYNLPTPNLTGPSLTVPQLATPNLQQFFPQATRQSLLGAPPVGVPINPSQINLSGRTPQKQARTPSSTTPNRKTVPVEDKSDPPEGSEEVVESRTDTPEDQDSPPCPDGIAKEKHTVAPEPESCEASEPPAKRSKSSELPTEKGAPGQLQAKVQPQARTTAPKQTQTPELLPEPPEARVLPRFQPRVLQIQAQVQPQTQPQPPPPPPPGDTQARPKLQKQAQTQTSPDHLVPQQVQPQQVQKEAEPQKQVQRQAHPQPPGQAQPQQLAQTQTYPQVQPPEQPPGQPPVQPPDRTEGQPQTWPQVSMPASEQAPVPVRSTVAETPPDPRDAGAGLKEASPEPGGSQVSVESQEELTSGLDVGECEKRAREMLGVWGAGGSLKVTILQSSDSRAFSTVPLTPVPRAGDSASATPASASTASKQTLQFFCYLCKASCSSQQEFQDHMAGAQHQQRLGEIQHMSQACLLSLLPVPRDVLEREDEGFVDPKYVPSWSPKLALGLRRPGGREPPPRRWCNTCQVYYMGDLIQHRRTQDHKIAKQSLRPFCTVCNRYFKTPRKFVEHVKSQGHKDKAKELKMLEKEIAGQDEDHFITVDAVGCFEGDEEEEEEEEDEEEEIEVEEEFCKQVRSRDISIEEWKGSETYSPSTAYGVDFLVPVMGYICRICHKFYHSNSGAQLSHCKSLAHFENLQKYKKAKNPSPTSRPVSRRCAINARNALTALFTSGGRAPTQPSTQDTAKTPSKVTAQPPPPPLPRRSTRLKT
ncbi:cip1-interacting zinc finger protein isoform X2 [Prionailurus viverrinus]|uniref:cip1-interacting zinc finger protein isoform X2 n=1 Tax=Prionailurus viverrinus TaxID=61388 RepID=UPI001FF44066|nr:cip1-interacting zinc finger protein isoform X2 [Prionailurus viverrinus]